MRPGLPGYSENIRVCSVVGRFLEHSRIFFFHNAGDPLVYLGSADWQRRNLEDRVEAIVPVEDPALRQRCMDIMQLYFGDRRLAWDLGPDGRYVQRQPVSRDEEDGVTGTVDTAGQASHKGSLIAGNYPTPGISGL